MHFSIALFHRPLFLPAQRSINIQFIGEKLHIDEYWISRGHSLMLKQTGINCKSIDPEIFFIYGRSYFRNWK